MNKWLIFIFMQLFVATLAFANPIKVAIIDTGKPNIGVKPCDEGHKDFTGLGLQDTHGHGSNISYIIDRYAGNADYCQLYLKYYNSAPNSNNLKTSLKAWRHAIDQNVDIIIYAGGGTEYSGEEESLVKEALNKKIFVFVAAGNESTNLETNCNYYPACLDFRVVKVGCKKRTGELCTKSNYAKNLENFMMAEGYQVSAGGHTLTGTSQATANVVGRFIKFYDKKRKSK